MGEPGVLRSIVLHSVLLTIVLQRNPILLSNYTHGVLREHNPAACRRGFVVLTRYGHVSLNGLQAFDMETRLRPRSTMSDVSATVAQRSLGTVPFE